MTPDPARPVTYQQLAFKLVARSGLPTVVIAFIILWMFGLFTYWGLESPLSRIEKKLDHILYIEKAMCRRMFRDTEKDKERARWLGCTERPQHLEEDK